MKRFVKVLAPLGFALAVTACAAWSQPPGVVSGQPSSACLPHRANCQTDHDCCTMNCKNNICVEPPIGGG